MSVFTRHRIENNAMIIYTAPIETTWDIIEKELEDRYVKGYKEFEWRWRGFQLDEKKEWEVCVWRNPMVEDSDEEDSDEEDEESDNDE